MWRLLSICLLLAVPVLAQQKFPAPTRDDRIVVVAPHPDDEILGAGGLIQAALAVGADVRVVYLTNGDHNQVAFKLYSLDLHLSAQQYLGFGEKRRREAIAGTAKLGLPADHLTFLGYPDWGTLRIWRDYWNAPKPFRSDATRVEAVPYPEAFCPGSPYRPQSVEADFVELFRQFKPTMIFVTHPGDTAPDHRAAANFVRLAALDLEAEGLRPTVYYYVVHFGRWPRPYHYHPDLGLEPPTALLDNGDWMSFPLSTNQTARKHDAILENRTQVTTRQYFLVAFARTNELFATIPLVSVPCLPEDAPLDWRKAVRNKALTVAVPDASDLHAPAEEWISIQTTDFLRQGNDLIALVDFKNRLGKRTGVYLSLFGYQRGVAFEKLPKVEIHIGPLGGLKVYASDKRVAQPGVTVTSVANRFFVRVPLRLLGGERLDHVFTCTRAHLGEIAMDDTAWQLFDLEKG
jgi:LmbE family N-acetylglucosaminyl deacetylase